MVNKFLFIITLCFLCIQEGYSYHQKTAEYINLERIDSLQKVGRVFYHQAKIDSSLIIYKQALQITDEKHYALTERKLYYYIGDSYFRKQDFGLAIKFYEKYRYDNQNYNAAHMSHVLHRLSICYRNIGLYKKAMELELINLDFINKKEDPISVWESNYQIGGILVFQKDYEGALKHYKKALDIARDIDSPQHDYTPLGAIGYTYHQMDSLDKALNWTLKALAFADSIQYSSGITHSYYNLGLIYSSQKKFHKAKQYLEKTLERTEELNAPDKQWSLASTHYQLGNLHLQMNNHSSAEFHLKKGISTASNINAQAILKDLYLKLSELKTAQKKHEEANSLLGKHLSLRDEIDAIDLKQRIISDKIVYEIREKDKEILQLKGDKESSRVRSQYIMYILGLALPLLLFSFIAYAKLNKTKRKLEKINVLIGTKNALLKESNTKLENSNQKLEESNQLLEESNTKLEDSNAKLEDSNKELEQFAYVASHDMREPIRTIRSFNSLLERKYKSQLGDGMEFVHFIGDASKRLDKMLTDLLSYSRVSTKNHEREILNLKTIVQDTIESLDTTLQQANAKVILHSLPDDVLVNSLQMERLFQNLITNGIKYNVNEKKRIEISYTTTEQAYIIAVKDNGIGIPSEHHEEVFEIFRRLHGVGKYEGSGIGLATCKKIIERHGGKIWLKSQEEIGTTVFFSLPFLACEFEKTL